MMAIRHSVLVLLLLLLLPLMLKAIRSHSLAHDVQKEEGSAFWIDAVTRSPAWTDVRILMNLPLHLFSIHD